eukprot:365535-Chlamydomonas_euryale.AAC.94
MACQWMPMPVMNWHMCSRVSSHATGTQRAIPIPIRPPPPAPASKPNVQCMNPCHAPQIPAAAPRPRICIASFQPRRCRNSPWGAATCEHNGQGASTAVRSRHSAAAAAQAATQRRVTSNRHAGVCVRWSAYLWEFREADAHGLIALQRRRIRLCWRGRELEEASRLHDKCGAVRSTQHVSALLLTRATRCSSGVRGGPRACAVSRVGQGHVAAVDLAVGHTCAAAVLNPDLNN